MEIALCEALLLRTDERVFRIPAHIRDAMVAHAEAALPNEGCGLLAGRDGAVERFFPMANADRSRVTYRLDPAEQIKVFNEIEDRRWELSGIFHSHTHTPAYPSETDRRQAFYPEARYVLVSMAEGTTRDLRAYTIVDGLIEEQEVRIV